MGDYPGLSTWAQGNHKILCKGEPADFEGVRRGQEPRNAGGLQEPEKQGIGFPLQSLWRNTGPAPTLILGLFDFKSCEVLTWVISSC